MTASAMLKSLFMTGVDAVRGYNAVRNTLEKQSSEAPTLIIAVGKAAGDMALGARAYFGSSIETIIVTKYGHVSEELAALAACEIYESRHPIPDKNSLIAGARLLDAVQSQPADARLLMLVSGGASALVEVPKPDISYDELVTLNHEAMAEGVDIGAINAKRIELSQVKGGGLLAAFSGASINTIAISDVEGDSIDVIASGIGAFHGNDGKATTTIAASNAVARQAIIDAAGDLPICYNQETLYTSAEDAAALIHTTIRHGDAGLYVFGGEPTVRLPDNPGRGGRNQHIALLLAEKFRGTNDTTILVAGTDGTDGPTDEAGAIIDGTTIPASADVSAYLAGADAGTFLAQREALLTTGPTGTNVMDLVIAIKT